MSHREPPNYKNKVAETCRYWKEGKCLKGEYKCSFIHGYICADKGRCRRDNCSRIHLPQPHMNQGRQYQDPRGGFGPRHRRSYSRSPSPSWHPHPYRGRSPLYRRSRSPPRHEGRSPPRYYSPPPKHYSSRSPVRRRTRSPPRRRTYSRSPPRHHSRAYSPHYSRSRSPSPRYSRKKSWSPSRRSRSRSRSKSRSFSKGRSVSRSPVRRWGSSPRHSKRRSRTPDRSRSGSLKKSYKDYKSPYSRHSRSRSSSPLPSKISRGRSSSKGPVSRGRSSPDVLKKSESLEQVKRSESANDSPKSVGLDSSLLSKYMDSDGDVSSILEFKARISKGFMQPEIQSLMKEILSATKDLNKHEEKLSPKASPEPVAVSDSDSAGENLNLEEVGEEVGEIFTRSIDSARESVEATKRQSKIKAGSNPSPPSASKLVPKPAKDVPVDREIDFHTDWEIKSALDNPAKPLMREMVAPLPPKPTGQVGKTNTANTLWTPALDRRPQPLPKTKTQLKPNEWEVETPYIGRKEKGQVQQREAATMKDKTSAVVSLPLQEFAKEMQKEAQWPPEAGEVRPSAPPTMLFPSGQSMASGSLSSLSAEPLSASQASKPSVSYSTEYTSSVMSSVPQDSYAMTAFSKKELELHRLKAAEEIPLEKATRQPTEGMSKSSRDIIEADSSTAVYEEKKREKSETVQDTNDRDDVNVLIDKKDSLLKRIRLLVEQKNMMNNQREDIIKKHKGSQENLNNILEENSFLTKEIAKQIDKIYDVVQKLNNDIESKARVKGEKYDSPHYSQEKQRKDMERLKPRRQLHASPDTRLDKEKTQPTPSRKMSPPRKEKYSPTGHRSGTSFQYAKFTNDNLKSKYLKPEDEYQSPSFQNLARQKRDRSQERSHHLKERPSSSSSELKSSYSPSRKRPAVKSEINKVQPAKPVQQPMPFQQPKPVPPPSQALKEEDESLQYAPMEYQRTYFRYVDQGMHWCKLCNIFCETAPEYVTHLMLPSHLAKVKNDRKTWLAKPGKEEKEVKPPNAHVVTVPLQGLEFMHSLPAYYCSLCDLFMRTKGEAVRHPESKTHVSNYKIHRAKNPCFELTLMKAKTSAYAKYKIEEERKLNVENASQKEKLSREVEVKLLKQVKEKMDREVKIKKQRTEEDGGDEKSKNFGSIRVASRGPKNMQGSSRGSVTPPKEEAKPFHEDSATSSESEKECEEKLEKSEETETLPRGRERSWDEEVRRSPRLSRDRSSDSSSNESDKNVEDKDQEVCDEENENKETMKEEESKNKEEEKKPITSKLPLIGKMPFLKKKKLGAMNKNTKPGREVPHRAESQEKDQKQRGDSKPRDEYEIPLPSLQVTDQKQQYDSKDIQRERVVNTEPHLKLQAAEDTVKEHDNEEKQRKVSKPSRNEPCPVMSITEFRNDSNDEGDSSDSDMSVSEGSDFGESKIECPSAATIEALELLRIPLPGLTTPPQPESQEQMQRETGKVTVDAAPYDPFTAGDSPCLAATKGASVDVYSGSVLPTNIPLPPEPVPQKPDEPCPPGTEDIFQRVLSSEWGAASLEVGVSDEPIPPGTEDSQPHSKSIPLPPAEEPHKQQMVPPGKKDSKPLKEPVLLPPGTESPKEPPLLPPGENSEPFEETLPLPPGTEPLKVLLQLLPVKKEDSEPLEKSLPLPPGTEPHKELSPPGVKDSERLEEPLLLPPGAEPHKKLSPSAIKESKPLEKSLPLSPGTEPQKELSPPRIKDSKILEEPLLLPPGTEPHKELSPPGVKDSKILEEPLLLPPGTEPHKELSPLGIKNSKPLEESLPSPAGTEPHREPLPAVPGKKDSTLHGERTRPVLPGEDDQKVVSQLVTEETDKVTSPVKELCEKEHETSPVSEKQGNQVTGEDIVGVKSSLESNGTSQVCMMTEQPVLPSGDEASMDKLENKADGTEISNPEAKKGDGEDDSKQGTMSQDTVEAEPTPSLHDAVLGLDVTQYVAGEALKTLQQESIDFSNLLVNQIDPVTPKTQGTQGEALETAGLCLEKSVDECKTVGTEQILSKEADGSDSSMSTTKPVAMDDESLSGTSTDISGLQEIIGESLNVALGEEPSPHVGEENLQLNEEVEEVLSENDDDGEGPAEVGKVPSEDEEELTELEEVEVPSRLEEVAKVPLLNEELEEEHLSLNEGVEGEALLHDDFEADRNLSLEAILKETGILGAEDIDMPEESGDVPKTKPRQSGKRGKKNTKRAKTQNTPKSKRKLRNVIQEPEDKEQEEEVHVSAEEMVEDSSAIETEQTEETEEEQEPATARRSSRSKRPMKVDAAIEDNRPVDKKPRASRAKVKSAACVEAEPAHSSRATRSCRRAAAAASAAMLAMAQKQTVTPEDSPHSADSEGSE